MNFYNDKNHGIYFRKTKGGNYTLVRADKTYITNQKRNPMFEELGGQAGDGWMRSMLLMKEYGIWDVTGFGCTMSTGLGYVFKPRKQKPYALIFFSCEFAEKRYYESLPKETVDLCRTYVDEFYADPEAQLRWEGMIVHPICLKLEKGSDQFIPVRLNDLAKGDKMLDRKYVHPVFDISDMKEVQERLFSY